MPGYAATPRALELGLRLLLACTAIILLAYAFGRDAVAYVLPLIRNVLATLDEREQIVALTIMQHDPDTMLQLSVRLLQDIVVEGRRFTANGYLFTSTIGIGLMLQPAMIALSLVLAWPAQHAIDYLPRLGIAVVLLAIVFVADAPLTLWANYRHTLAPNESSPLWLWEEFLVHGGRLALGLLIAVIAIEAARYMTRGHSVK